MVSNLLSYRLSVDRRNSSLPAANGERTWKSGVWEWRFDDGFIEIRCSKNRDGIKPTTRVEYKNAGSRNGWSLVEAQGISPQTLLVNNIKLWIFKAVFTLCIMESQSTVYSSAIRYNRKGSNRLNVCVQSNSSLTQLPILYPLLYLT